MSETVDAYHEWLGIPPEDQPPSHYRLLGLDPFEGDRATIDAAAKSLMGMLQKQLGGPNQALIRKLLDEISDARRCLLLSDRKSAYDQTLRASLTAKQESEPHAAVESVEPEKSFDAPVVEPIDIEPAEEISAAVPIPDEAVPEAEPMPLEEVEAAPEPELLDDADDPPEVELFDEIDEPTTLEQIGEAQSAQLPEVVVVPQAKAAPAPAPQIPAKTPSPAPAKPAAATVPAKPAAKSPAPNKQPIAAAARPAAPAAAGTVTANVAAKVVEPAAADDAHGWEATESAAGDEAIDGSFFSGMGLSSVRAGGAQASAAAGTVFEPSAAGGPSAGTAKDGKSFPKKNNPKSLAGAKSAAVGTQSEGKSTVKTAPKRGPQMWQIMVGVGGAVVVLILVFAAMSGGGPTTEVTTAHPVAPPKEQPHIAFGPHTVVGPLNDRTMRSPVTGAPVRVPLERHGDLMLVDVKINDQDAGKFLVDTGTADLIISKEVADKLKLPSRHSKNLKMPGGMQSITERKIDSLAMGAVRFEEAMIEPQPTNDEWLALAADIKPWADAVELPINGVIGGEVLSQVPFSIDPSSKVLTFFKKGRFPFSEGQKPEFLTRFDNFRKPAISATIETSPEGTFVLATGAPDALMVKGSAAPVRTLNLFGQVISDPATVESKNGDGYFDPNEIRQSGVIGAGILSHYILMFDYEHESFMAAPIKK